MVVNRGRRERYHNGHPELNGSFPPPLTRARGVKWPGRRVLKKSYRCIAF